MRAELAAARESAHADRLRVEAEGGGDDALAAINATEQAAITRARDEVYVGFHELESLMAEPDVEMPSELPEPEPEPEPEPGSRIPKPVIPTLKKPHSAPIPKDLVEDLGPEGTQALYGSAAYCDWFVTRCNVGLLVSFSVSWSLGYCL